MKIQGKRNGGNAGSGDAAVNHSPLYSAHQNVRPQCLRTLTGKQTEAGLLEGRRC